MSRRVWEGIITCGLAPAEDDIEGLEQLARVRLAALMALVGLALSLLVCTLRFRAGLSPAGLSPAAATLLFATVFAVLRATRSVRWAGFLLLVGWTTATAAGITTGGFADSGILYALPVPLFVLFLYGRRAGGRLLALFAVVDGLLCGAAALRLLPSPYAPGLLLSGFLALLFLSLLAWLYEERTAAAADRMHRRIFLDPLTGLPNRTMLLRDLSRLSAPLLILVNLDDFKEVNAACGHRVGDEVLIFLARQLVRYLPAFAHGVYRLAGDEFAVLADGAEQPLPRREIENAVRLLAEFIHSERLVCEGKEIAPRVSMGIAGSDELGTGGILSGADIALKTAKRVNRPYLFYSEALDTRERFESNIRWFNILSDALDNDRIVPYYQPIVDNLDQSISRYECLIRLIDREGHLVLPAQFLEVAKRTRLYPRLTRAVIRKAVDVFRGSGHTFSVNLSAQDFLNPDFPRYVRYILSENPTVRGRLAFEILESKGIENYSQIGEFIREMKEMGCLVALDDFGSGYSNFEPILRLKLDCIKIDGSLIRNICSEDGSRLIVENIVGYCRKMGICTVAEYVHSEEVYRAVRALGVDYSQGFFLGRPEPAMRAGTGCVPEPPAAEAGAGTAGV